MKGECSSCKGEGWGWGGYPQGLDCYGVYQELLMKEVCDDCRGTGRADPAADAPEPDEEEAPPCK